MATLAVTITESVTLNGAARGSTNSLSITGVNDIYHRIVSCPDDVPLSLVTFKSTVGVTIAEQLMAIELVKYIRITNLNGTHPIILNLLIDSAESAAGAADMSTSIEVEAGKSFIFGSPHLSISNDDDAATVNVSNVALFDLRSIHLDPVSEAVQVEVFIASA
tara:strand:- start:237 stop:725 length:489 start_codon:yes stop_codon:yes gene_type:complete